MEYKPMILDFYKITHSPEYSGLISGLRSVAGIADAIGNALCHWTIKWMLCGYGEQLKMAAKAPDYLEQARSRSQRAVEAILTLEKFPPEAVSKFFMLPVILGLLLLIPGCILIRRARA